MDPDNESPLSRAERTFWTVWYYVSGAVSRFLRPEATNNISSDPTSSQESVVNSGPTESGHTEDDASSSSSTAKEDEPLVPASLLGSSQAIVVWDISLEPDEEQKQCKAQLSKATEEHESMREEQYGQAGNDDAGHTQASEDEEEDEAEDKEEDEEESDGEEEEDKEEEDEEESDGEEEEEDKENIDLILHTYKQVESLEDEDEEDAKMESLHLTDGVMSEDITRSREKDGAEEETHTSRRLKNYPEKMDETTADIKVKDDEDKIHDEHKQDVEAEGSEIKSNTTTYHDVKEEDNIHTEEASVQRNDANTAVTCEEAENFADEEEKAESHVSVGEQLLEYDIDVKRDTDKEDEVTHRSDEDEEEEEDEIILHEREQYEEGIGNEAAYIQTIDEKTELEENVKPVTEDSKERDIKTEHVTCSKEVTLNAKTEVHAAEFTDEEQEDVAKKTQTKTREIDDAVALIDEKSFVTTADVVVDEIFFDEDQVEEEITAGEENEKTSHMEIECTINSVTVKPEAETVQEVNNELNNIPLRMCEGQVVVSPELNSPTCEETKEGVPEHNNEPQPDENTTQWFLEVGDYEEIQTPQLPEEVESQKPESLQNSGCSTDAGFSLGKEHREQEQESTEEINKEYSEGLHFTDTGLPQKTDKPLEVIQESGLLFEEDEGTFSVHSMKTGIEHSEKEFETHVGLADEPEETTTELQDETEELLVTFETDEELSDSRGAAGDVSETTGALAAGEVLGFADETSELLDTEATKMMNTSVFQESADAINSDQNCNMISSLLEDIAESGFLEESLETEPNILEGCAVEMQDAVIHMEVTGYELEEDEMQNKNQMEMLNLQLVEVTAEPTEESDKNQSAMTAESELDEAFEISNEEILTDTEAADRLMTTEFKAKDLTVTSTEDMAKSVTELEGCYAKETSSSVSEHQDVIDEEILDLWIQAVSSEDTDQMKQEGPEPGQQIDINIEQSNEEQAGILSMQAEVEKEQLVESNSGESELVSDKAESGFLDLSLTTEWDTQTSETQPLKSTCTQSFQDDYDMLASVSESADISELSKSESQDILMEEAAETEQLDLKKEGSITETEFSADSGVTQSDARPQNQELYESQEKLHTEQVELLENESGSQKDTDPEITDFEMKIDWEDGQDVNANSQTSAEKAEDESPEITMSDSPAEIEHSASGRPKSGSEVLLEEGIKSEETGSEETQTGSQVASWTESEKSFKLPSLEKPWSRSEVTALTELELEYPTANSEDLLEVDSSSLDFSAQRSRIALKNPLVRPPKDPRSLLHMPSLEPTPRSHLPVKVPAGVPLGGLGVGIKLPGLGAGFPVLKKTQRVVREEKSPETSREPETKPEDKGDVPQQDEAQQKPRWMPPKHPGFGNPLMSELKSKLKKTTKE